jgi:hypothetical protein
MGTYLTLELKNKTDKAIRSANNLWNSENAGYENTLHFNTRKDIQEYIDAIPGDPLRVHLRHVKTVQDWNKNSPTCWNLGCFEVKITLGDYLCSEMAKRYIKFLNSHPDLFVEFPPDHVMQILIEAARKKHKATSCLVECPYCASVMQPKSAAQQSTQASRQKLPAKKSNRKGSAPAKSG